MKFIHTADWHLGKLLKEQSLTEDQEWLLMNQFLSLVDEEKPDVILLAGDVYDRSYPPEEAVELFDKMTEEIVGKRHIPFIVISGNHDSAERLAVASRLLRNQGLYIFGPLNRLKPVILEDAWGQVAFCPLPYAEPARVRVLMNQKDLPGVEDIHSYESAEQKLSDMLLEEIEDKNIRKVAVAHAFAAGGQSSESERPLSIGGYDQISDTIFAPYCYTALGHLHRPQKTRASSEKIQYSGSLMRYSFDEVKQKKGVIVGEIDGEGQVKTTFHNLVPRYQVRTLTGQFADLMSDETEDSDDYLQIILTDTEPVLDAMPKLHQKYPHALGVEQDMGYKEDSGDRNIQLEQMSDQDIFKEFVHHFRDRDLNDEEEALSLSAWEEVYRKENSK